MAPTRGLFAASGLLAAGLGLLVFVFGTVQTRTTTSLGLASEVIAENKTEVAKLERQVRRLTVHIGRISREFGIPPTPPPGSPDSPSDSPEPAPTASLPGPLPVPSVSPPPLPTPTPIPTPSPTCLPIIGCLP